MLSLLDSTILLGSASHMLRLQVGATMPSYEIPLLMAVGYFIEYCLNSVPSCLQHFFFFTRSKAALVIPVLSYFQLKLACKFLVTLSPLPTW
jgi:hypothetical protein